MRRSRGVPIAERGPGWSYRPDEAPASLHANCRIQLEPELERHFLERISYHRGDFGDDATFDTLAERLEQMHLEHETRSNLLFYLATQPSAFAATKR